MSKINIKKRRSRAKIDFTKPVVIVNRSNKNIMAQLVTNFGAKTEYTFNSSTIKEGTKTEKATMVGKKLAEAIKALKIESVVFNRNGYIFHGRVKAVADAIKEQGIKI